MKEKVDWKRVAQVAQLVLLVVIAVAMVVGYRRLVGKVAVEEPPVAEPTREPTVIAWATAQAEQTEVISTLVAQVAQLEESVVREVEVEETTFGIDPQPQVAHPSFYAETGIKSTKTWELDVPEDSVLIAGGVVVNGVTGGVYRAWPGDQEVIVAVTNGFVLVVEEPWAEAEFCFRLSQAEQFGWAHAHEEMLPAWEPCPDPAS